jgi:hypothetical protein
MAFQEALNSTEMKGRVSSLAAELQESQLTEFSMGKMVADAFREAGACNADVLATEYNKFAAKHSGADYGKLPKIALVYAGESDDGKTQLANIMKVETGSLVIPDERIPLALNIKIPICDETKNPRK